MDAFAMIKRILSESKLHKIRIVVNRADTEEEAKTIAENFIDVVAKFLGVRISTLGTITVDKAFVKAIKDQIPFIIESPSSNAAIQLNNIADDYLKIPRTEKRPRGGIGNFVKKLIRKK